MITETHKKQMLEAAKEGTGIESFPAVCNISPRELNQAAEQDESFADFIDLCISHEIMYWNRQCRETVSQESEDLFSSAKDRSDYLKFCTMKLNWIYKSTGGNNIRSKYMKNASSKKNKYITNTEVDQLAKSEGLELDEDNTNVC